MDIEVKHSVVDGQMLKWILAAGVSWLEYHKNQVNDMNVFPVPDGDTGINMLLTIRKAYQQIADNDEKHIGKIMEQVARGALTGARGNSGTILSMLLRGFSHELKDQPVMDAHSFVRACQSAVDYAYDTVSSVMEPVEGTILTVARESAESIKGRNQAETSLRVLLTELIDAAYSSLENTPNLLPKLKEAGVVDSGGLGLVYILEGMKRFVNGEPVSFGEGESLNVQEARDWQEALVPDDEEGYGYDVQFLMLGENLDVHQVRHDISAMGWSPLVDGDKSLIKVHIHVHNPGDPLAYAINMGAELDDIVVENMQAQYLQYVQSRSDRESQPQNKQVGGVAIVTVVRGDGLESLFDEYGAARIILGGQTMNPSTEDFLSAIESLETNEIILLPNNGNVIMAAQQAAALAVDKKVCVVPSKTVQQGIAALMVFMDLADDGSLQEIQDSMNEALASVLSGEITTATRDVKFDGVNVQEGQYIGLLDGKLVASNSEITQTVFDLLAQANADSYELLTVYYGEGSSEQAAEVLVGQLEDRYPDLEYEVVYGGQPLYPYLFSLE
jgi:hypothetical protein